MKPKNFSLQKEELGNFLKKIMPEAKYFIKQDEILGKTFAVAEDTGEGTYNVKSSFMGFNEMNCFFWGILFFKNKTKN